MSSKFSTGSIIVKKPLRWYKEDEDIDINDITTYTVVDPPTTDYPNTVFVKYTNSKNGSVYSFKDSELILQSELADLCSKLEQEYKLDAAAQLLKEADQIANDNNFQLTGMDLRDEMSQLLSTMDDLGWNTSSLHC
jgi:hypothetical protein